MSDTEGIAADLRVHLTLCTELFILIERENQLLLLPQDFSRFEFYRQRKEFLPALDESLDKLKQHRAAWHRLSASERQHSPEIFALIHSLQDLIMRIVMLDRENEQLLLRRGIFPARQAAVMSPEPHFVVEVYRRCSQRPT